MGLSSILITAFFKKRNVFYFFKKVLKKMRTMCIIVYSTVGLSYGGEIVVKIDIRSRTPIYEQIIESIREMVVKGVLKPSDKLPSVREMAKEMTLNPNTVQKAYQELERQGLICTVRGRGTFICEEIKPKDKEGKIDELLFEMNKLLVAGIYLGLKKEVIISEIEKIYNEIEETRENKK